MACDGLAKASWSATSTTTRTSSCCRSQTHSSSCKLSRESFAANADYYSPGDYLRAEDDEIDGFKARLNECLAPVGTQFTGEGVNDEWVVGDTLAQWWRPNFETFMYPFIPAHVTRPKECKKLYFIQLPRSSTLHHVSQSTTGLLITCRGPERPEEHEASRRPAVRTIR